MTIPYSEPLKVRTLAERVIPEPPRRGEPGGDPCGICGGQTTSAVWSNDELVTPSARRRKFVRRSVAGLA